MNRHSGVVQTVIAVDRAGDVTLSFPVAGPVLASKGTDDASKPSHDAAAVVLRSGDAPLSSDASASVEDEAVVEEDPYEAIETLRASLEESQIALSLVNRDRALLYSEVARLNDALAAASVANQDMADLMAMDDDAFVAAARSQQANPAQRNNTAAAPAVMAPLLDDGKGQSAAPPAQPISDATKAASSSTVAAVPPPPMSTASRLAYFTGLPLLTSLLSRATKSAAVASPAPTPTVGDGRTMSATPSETPTAAGVASPLPKPSGVTAQSGVSTPVAAVNSDHSSTLAPPLSSSDPSQSHRAVNGSPSLRPRSPSDAPSESGRASPSLSAQGAPMQEVVFENQRRLLAGWRKTFLITDRHEFSDETGKLHRYLFTRACVCVVLIGVA